MGDSTSELAEDGVYVRIVTEVRKGDTRQRNEINSSMSSIYMISASRTWRTVGTRLLIKIEMGGLRWAVFKSLPVSTFQRLYIDC
jgi:hypothetical protein